MTVTDFLPLVEKIRKRIGSWTGRFLSYAGHLQLINSVIRSLTNFWMADFRLPSGCIKEIDRICSAFLWSGPELNGRKAKISWSEVCRTKQEGGLGLRPLKEVNLVSVLKLLWRVLSAKSLWVNWIKIYLIRKSSIWMIKESTQGGSWMWRKILKCRELAKSFYKVEVRNGSETSFWYENWSSLGCLHDTLGDGGYIDLGISATATVEDSRNHRRRNHRVQFLNTIEVEIEKFKRNWSQEEDISLWKNDKGKYKKSFSTKDTWLCIREKHVLYSWHKMIWFKHATPRDAFVSWMAVRGVGSVMRGTLRDQYTTRWESLIQMISGGNSGWSKVKIFTVRYMFQSAIHMLWRERNGRRHGEPPSPVAVLIKRLDKNMRNIFLVIQRRGDCEYKKGLENWFESRREVISVRVRADA
ncbi:uncharacterized protein LOC108845266 [Raphanus sativus]|uniref:Uncharacterized protein LOC108845266 n=1 Tax=Raphanus sativus TaxID=3726 RepID=A0A6J0MNF9_RAPSA|nr:uncharacterized protein LOC108845266 [Raphanus sativus]